MPRSVNPQITNIAQDIGAIGTNANAAARAVSDAATSGKANLDRIVSQNAGGVLDGRNMTVGNVTGQIGSAMGNVGSTIRNTAAGLDSAIRTTASGISGSVSNLVGGGLASGVGSIVTKAAGQINNFLSLVRGTNLPAGGELFKKESTAINLNPGSKNDWRVRINTNWEIFGENELFSRLSETGGVVFPFLPEITISTSANYSAVEPTHSNFATQVYKNSVVNDITISGEFSAETATDAEYWIAATTFFKTATKMFFGQGNNAGNPPVICNLSGYGTNVFANVPVVIKSFEVTLPKDVNYIKYESVNSFDADTWVPVFSTITVVVAPVYNRERLRKFSLQDYAKGGMVSSDGKNVGYL